MAGTLVLDPLPTVTMYAIQATSHLLMAGTYFIENVDANMESRLSPAFREKVAPGRDQELLSLNARSGIILIQGTAYLW